MLIEALEIGAFYRMRLAGSGAVINRQFLGFSIEGGVQRCEFRTTDMIHTHNVPSELIVSVVRLCEPPANDIDDEAAA